MKLKAVLNKEIKTLKEKQIKEMDLANNSNVFIGSIFQTHVLIQGTLRLFYRNIIDLLEDMENGICEFEKSRRLLEMQDELIKYSGYLADEEMRMKKYLTKEITEEMKIVINSFLKSLEDKDKFISKVMVGISN